MAGGVWEWCADDYDAAFYSASPEHSPLCRRRGDDNERQHVLRGGSWADCAEALRVSFRSASAHGATPNVGFRLVRVPRPGIGSNCRHFGTGMSTWRPNRLSG